MEKKLTLSEFENCEKMIGQANTTLYSMIKGEMQEKKEVVVPIPDIYDVDVPYSIAYNGGNHPEYASNVYSQIGKIEWKEETEDVVIHTEDGVQYLHECDTASLCAIAEFLLFMQTYTPQE